MSEQIGSFYSFAKVQDEFGISLIGEARIPKRDAAVCGIIMRMYAMGTLHFSFEIMVSVMSEQDDVQIIDAAEGNELIGMAVVTIPAYPEATALALVAEKGKGDDQSMEEAQKRIAELEAKLQ